MHLSVVIPAFNEAKKISRDLNAAQKFLATQEYDSEVLIVDDGSRDGTAKVVETLIESLSSPKVQFKLLRYEQNRGKGYAVRYGVERAAGDFVAFMDAGTCVPLRYLNVGLGKLMSGADVAIASRKVKDSKIIREQPLYRQAGSKVFWYVVQLGMGVHVSDTQCGFKLYRKEAAKEIFSRVQTDGFMFDIEALIIATKLGLKIEEFGVEWANDSDTRYHPVWGTIRNSKELFRIRMRSLHGE